MSSVLSVFTSGLAGGWTYVSSHSSMVSQSWLNPLPEGGGWIQVERVLA